MLLRSFVEGVVAAPARNSGKEAADMAMCQSGLVGAVFEKRSERVDDSTNFGKDVRVGFRKERVGLAPFDLVTTTGQEMEWLENKTDFRDPGGSVSFWSPVRSSRGTRRGMNAGKTWVLKGAPNAGHLDTAREGSLAHGRTCSRCECPSKGRGVALANEAVSTDDED